MTINLPFRPGTRIWYTKIISGKIRICSSIITNSQVVFNFSTDKVYNHKKFKYLNKTVSVFIDMKIITKDGHIFYYNRNSEIKNFFGTRHELINSKEYKNFIL